MNTTSTQTPVTHNASWMDAVLNALRSPGAMMVALVLALFPQGEHTAQVFMYFSHDRTGNAQFFAYAFAAAVEVAVLLFVLAGHKRISYLFAGASFLTNVVYYAIGGVALLTVAALPVLLLSALLPACIMGYSHTIAEKPKDAGTQPAQAPAKVRRYRWQFWRKPAESTTTDNLARAAAQTPVARPSATTGHPDATPTVTPAPAATPKQPEPDAIPQPDKRTQAMQLRDEGYTAAEIAKMTDAKYSTVQSWLRRATAQTNGVHQ